MRTCDFKWVWFDHWCKGDSVFGQRSQCSSIGSSDLIVIRNCDSSSSHIRISFVRPKSIQSATSYHLVLSKLRPYIRQMYTSFIIANSPLKDNIPTWIFGGASAEYFTRYSVVWAHAIFSIRCQKKNRKARNFLGANLGPPSTILRTRYSVNLGIPGISKDPWDQ